MQPVCSGQPNDPPGKPAGFGDFQSRPKPLALAPQSNLHLQRRVAISSIMAQTKKPRNPFYAALLAAGVVFAVTACAYGVMTVNLLSPAQVMEGAPTAGLVGFLDRHGTALLMAELGVLAALTFAAMGTDDYWTRRAAPNSPEPADDQTSEA
jgi:hypothetical protein